MSDYIGVFSEKALPVTGWIEYEDINGARVIVTHVYKSLEEIELLNKWPDKIIVGPVKKFIKAYGQLQPYYKSFQTIRNL